MKIFFIFFWKAIKIAGSAQKEQNKKKTTTTKQKKKKKKQKKKKKKGSVGLAETRVFFVGLIHYWRGGA